MRPILFEIPVLDLPIYSYGLMLVIGFLCAVQLAKHLARRSGLNPEIFVNAALIALLTGVIGSRLSHVLENIGQYTDPNRSFAANLWDAVNIRSGGLTFYGGLLLATPILIWYAVKNKLPLLHSMDIIAPTIMIGLAFGRIGCFLNGCCYGAACDLPTSVQFPYLSSAYVEQFESGKLVPPGDLLIRSGAGMRLISWDEIETVEQMRDALKSKPRADVRSMYLVANSSEKHALYTDALLDHASTIRSADLTAIARNERSLEVHPAQILSALNAFFIAGILLAYYTMPHAAGRVFALMLILKGVSRFMLEMLRSEPAVFGPLSFSMAVSAFVLVPAGVAFWFLCGYLEKNRGESALAPAPAASQK